MMKRVVYFLAVFFLATVVMAAALKLPTIPKSGKQVTDFVPKGWHILSDTRGDVSMDGREDILLALGSDAEDKASVDEELPRLFIILTGDADGGFTRAAVSSKMLLCKNCGGVRGDPFRKPEIKNGMIIIRQEGGSRDTWQVTHQFVYKNGTWVLTRGSMRTEDTANPGTATVVETNYETGETTQKQVGPKGVIGFLKKAFTPQAPTGITAFDVATSQQLNSYPLSP